MLPFATSGLVLGTGLFLILRPFVSEIALPIAVLVNALMSLPFLYRILAPETARLETDYGRLSASLDLPRITWLRYVALPRLARPFGYGAGLAAALSMGDLGVIALFGDDQSATLPLLVQRLMGAYRMDAAAAVALILVLVSAGMFFVLDAWGRRYAAT
jgi:thiamine transport system permease protein